MTVVKRSLRGRDFARRRDRAKESETTARGAPEKATEDTSKPSMWMDMEGRGRAQGEGSVDIKIYDSFSNEGETKKRKGAKQQKGVRYGSSLGAMWQNDVIW
jgi:hypothetical protein